jgi:hypothetical protein
VLPWVAEWAETSDATTLQRVGGARHLENEIRRVTKERDEKRAELADIEARLRKLQASV